MAFVTCDPQRNGRFEELATGLLAALPDVDNDGLLLIGVNRLGAPFRRIFRQTDLAVEGLDRVLAIPTKYIADLIDHQAPSRPIPTPRSEALQMLVFAHLIHDPGKSLHPGVILSGALRALSPF